MKRYINWKGAGIAAAAVLLFAGGAALALAVAGGGSEPGFTTTATTDTADFDSAFSSEPATDPAATSRQSMAPGVNGRLNTAVIYEAVAKTLKMSPKDVKGQVEQGKTLAQMAAEHGSTRDALKSAIVAGEKAYLDKNVASGAVTQRYADQTLQAFTVRLDALMDQALNARRQAQ